MLVAENIHKKYLHHVLKGVSFKAHKEEIIGIAGENGSGKSTLLSALSGNLIPDDGNVTIEGKVGYVPQESALFNNLSVKDNLKFWAAAYKQPWKDVLPIVSGILPDDSDFFKKRVLHLSGGMKKRLSIALACLNSPEYLIMDEPTAALDIGFKGVLAQLMQKIRNEGKGVIFSSHQPDELLWCDRIYILRDGIFVYEGDPNKLGNLADALYGGKYDFNDAH
ncbi:MAG: ABC transporter ATP-binding protein [Defluviitaleaceae bacterium]|nr:ABC transporter ATP-binding protein [Defluviitaleaceae bacterium]